MPRLGLGTIERDATRLGVLIKPAQVAWIDYSLTSSISGFSSFSARKIWYSQQPFLTTVLFTIIGVTSNTNYCLFTLPLEAYNPSNSNGTAAESIIRVCDSSTSWIVGIATLQPGSTTVYCYPGVNTPPWTTGTPGATRAIAGTLLVPTDT